VSELDDKLDDVARQYDQVQAQLARPETSTDPDAIRRLGRELSRMEPAVEAYRRLQDTRRELLVFIELAMRRRRRVNDKCLRIADIGEM